MESLNSIISIVIDIIGADMSTRPGSSQMNDAEKVRLDELADYLKVISDSHRLQIICMLAAGECCVCDMHESLGIPQNLTSHHLKALREADLVKTRREGKWVHYSLDVERILYLTDLYAELLLGRQG